jgi:hypothetical protein
VEHALARVPIGLLLLMAAAAATLEGDQHTTTKHDMTQHRLWLCNTAKEWLLT